MKRIIRKDGSIDYIYNFKELNQYMIGCIIKYDLKNDKIIIRTRGFVTDFKNVVIRKE